MNCRTACWAAMAAFVGLSAFAEPPRACRSVRTVEGEAESLLPEGMDFTLVWHDEFNGTQLDASKWSYRTNFWGNRAHWFATPEDKAVEVKGGQVYLKLVKRADGQFVTPQLQTGEIVWDVPYDEKRTGFWPLAKREQPKFEHRYGYYECRCRLQQLPGWWSAFWMQAPMQGCCLNPEYAGIEHDIMESFEPGEVIPSYFHANGYGADYLGFNTAHLDGNATLPEYRHLSQKFDKTQYHVFGLLWEKDGYTLYRDGQRVGDKLGRGKGEAVSQVPEFILLTTEAKYFRDNRATGKGHPDLEKTAAAGDDFAVDYVRVYDIKEK